MSFWERKILITCGELNAKDEQIESLTAHRTALLAACQHARRYITGNDSPEDGKRHPFRTEDTLRHLDEAIALCLAPPAAVEACESKAEKP